MFLLASRLPAGDSSPGFPSWRLFFLCLFFFFNCHCECTSASAGGAACLLGAILSLSHHLDVQGVRPGTQSRFAAATRSPVPIRLWGEGGRGHTGKATPSHPPPHGLRPAVLQSCRFCVGLGDCLLYIVNHVIITMNTWLLVINSKCALAA